MDNNKFETISLRKYADLAIQIAKNAGVKNSSEVGIAVIREYEKQLFEDLSHIPMGMG